MNAVCHDRGPGGLHDVIRIPGFLAYDCEVMSKVRVRLNERLEGMNETDLILARLEISDRQNEWSWDAKARLNLTNSQVVRDRMECRGDAVGDRFDFSFVESISIGDGFAREFAHGDDLSGGTDGALHGQPKLRGSHPREILGIFQEADVMNRNHDRDGAGKRRGILHMQQIRTVVTQLARYIETEPLE